MKTVFSCPFTFSDLRWLKMAAHPCAVATSELIRVP